MCHVAVVQVVYHLGDAAHVESDAGNAACHGFHDSVRQVLFQRGGHEDVHGIVDVHQLVFVADEVQRVDFEWKQVFQLLRLVAEDDDTQLFPEFGMLVGQQSARFYQVVNAFPFVRNLHRAEQHELFVLRQ